MNLGRDTAKQDLLLVTTGLVALLLFFWLYYDFHPLPAADNSLGRIVAGEKALNTALSFGFESDTEPVTKFKTNTVLLDTLQKRTNFKEFYSDSLNRTLYPVFYWSTLFKMGESDDRDGFRIGESGGPETVEIELSESGNLIAFTNNNNILPQPIFRPEVLNYGIQGDSLNVYSHSNDSLFIKSLEFLFNTQVNQQNLNRLQNNQVNYLGPSVAQRMAEFYLDKTGWRVEDLSMVSVEKVPIEELEGALVKFEYTTPDGSQPIQIETKILASGGLVSLTYSHTNPSDTDDTFSIIKFIVRAIVILTGAFWIIALLFIRFRLRLIDLKAATLAAVLAGLIFPFVVLLQQAYEHFQSFGSFDAQFIVPELIILGFLVAFSTLGFFAVTAISDSITRQHWPEKIRTIDVLRIGYFNNIPVGLSLIRGISYGFILSLVWCLILYLIPGSYISIDANFAADTTFFPYVSKLLGNFIFYLLVAQVIFLIFTGQARATFKSVYAVLIVPVFLFIVLYPFPLDVGAFPTEMGTAGIIGLLLGIIYYREDFLTTYVSMFISLSILSTASGWLIQNSPDASIFYSLIALIVVGFIAGGYSIYKGSSIRDVPKFVPEYIEELAQEDRIRQELKIARKVQQSFLPVSTPAVDGYEISAICKPAYETGGDYYDFISLADDQLAITIGDVSGKGIQAAFYMTFTKGVLHALCSDYKSTIEVLSTANNMFRNNAEKGTFISLIFGILDRSKNCFRFSRAGHNPVLYFNRSENKLYEYQPEGIAIGMGSEEVFRKNITEETIKLQKDDILILFTDGVVESISKTNKLYGDQRLQNFVKKNYKLSAAELLRKLEEDLEKFGEKSAQHDDLTMIVIKKK